jgi:transposase-like protein
MKKHRRTWSLAEKLEALQLLKKEGIGKTSRQLEVSSTTLYKWQALFEQQGEQGFIEKAASGKNPELERLQRENRELKIRTADAVGGRERTDY